MGRRKKKRYTARTADKHILYGKRVLPLDCEIQRFIHRAQWIQVGFPRSILTYDGLLNL